MGCNRRVGWRDTTPKPTDAFPFVPAPMPRRRDPAFIGMILLAGVILGLLISA